MANLSSVFPYIQCFFNREGSSYMPYQPPCDHFSYNSNVLKGKNIEQVAPLLSKIRLPWAFLCRFLRAKYYFNAALSGIDKFLDKEVPLILFPLAKKDCTTFILLLLCNFFIFSCSYQTILRDVAILNTQSVTYFLYWNNEPIWSLEYYEF